MPVQLTRILVFLLAFRAIVAPYTYRPTMPGQQLPRQTLRMRVRWWPPQRLQRFSRASKMLRLFEGKNRSVTGVDGRTQSLATIWPRLRPRFRFHLSCESVPLSPQPLTAVLRC